MGAGSPMGSGNVPELEVEAGGTALGSVLSATGSHALNGYFFRPVDLTPVSEEKPEVWWREVGRAFTHCTDP